MFSDIRKWTVNRGFIWYSPIGKINSERGFSCRERVKIHRKSMILTTLTLLILCHAFQRKSQKCTKNRDARAEPPLIYLTSPTRGRDTATA